MLLTLPTETIFHIASLLEDPTDLIALSSSCRRLSRIIRHATLYLRLLRRQGWDTEAIVRRAPRILSGAPQGSTVWIVYARSVFEKYDVLGRIVPAGVPIHSSGDATSKPRQQAGEKYVSKLASIALENGKHRLSPPLMSRRRANESLTQMLKTFQNSVMSPTLPRSCISPNHVLPTCSP